MTTTVFRACPLCEASCGLAFQVEGERIVGVKNDPDDPFSRGFVCPKSVGVKQLHHDPDRLKYPVRRTADGWQEISWAEAYEEVGTRLAEIREHYVHSIDGREPEIKLERTRDDEGTWRVVIETARADALPGRTAVRERPEVLVRAIDPQVLPQVPSL